VPVGAARPLGSRIVAPATADPEKGTDLVRRAAALGGFEVRFSADLARDLEDAALLVYITHEEGLGSGALLAMGAGVPVVASRVGGLEEAVVDGETGLLAGNTPEEIAGAVRAIVDDRTRAERMGSAGRRRALECFTVPAMTRGTLEVYRQVLA
jgi:glycosyltransferase involved in cell wall biosynthesis